MPSPVQALVGVARRRVRSSSTRTPPLPTCTRTAWHRRATRHRHCHGTRDAPRWLRPHLSREATGFTATPTRPQHATARAHHLAPSSWSLRPTEHHPAHWTLRTRTGRPGDRSRTRRQIKPGPFMAARHTRCVARPCYCTPLLSAHPSPARPAVVPHHCSRGSRERVRVARACTRTQAADCEHSTANPRVTLHRQAPVYQGIGMFQAHIVGPLASSMLLCTLTRVEVAVSGDDTIYHWHAPAACQEVPAYLRLRAGGQGDGLLVPFCWRPLVLLRFLRSGHPRVHVRVC